ncbi:MAG: S-methyl-5'-thioadenosine phosphorylase [bacterium]
MTRKYGKVKIAIIGGSGLCQMDELEKAGDIRVMTPFGSPSAPIRIGRIAGITCAFLPRHGKGHALLPCEIPQKANMYALKSLGVETVIAVSAVGSLMENLPPGHFVFPDQLVDETKRREYTFFGSGAVAHVSMAHPFCNALSRILHERAEALGIPSRIGGVYICMEGPAFSTKAESAFHRNMGYSIIGMTAAPEAKLAREAGLCYSPMALVTDYDVWKEGEEVSSEKVMATLAANIKNALRLIADAVPRLAELPRSCTCADMIKYAVFTPVKAMPAKTRKRLRLLLGD